jgi:hypothetical protein
MDSPDRTTVRGACTLQLLLYVFFLAQYLCHGAIWWTINLNDDPLNDEGDDLSMLERDK